ncbi:MAG: hypothetical protein JNK15_24635, partial [Planctomycetes bacterium]|nr:hypothetical protein [Planctomycetota bacterium]
MRLVLALAVAFFSILGACHDSRSSVADVQEPTSGSGGGTAPNGSDPKQPALRGSPTATIPATPSGGVPTLGSGVGGPNNANPMQAMSASVFAPVFRFSEYQNSYERLSTDTTGTRVHSAANSFSVGAEVGSPWFKAGVRRRQSTETNFTESTREFEGFVRLLTQRDYISLAAGHVSLSQDVMNRIASAEAARQAQNWVLLAAERASFESVYGMGFVSEVVLGHSMHIRCYAGETSSNSVNVNTFQTYFDTAFVTGDFSNASVIAAAAVGAGMQVEAQGLGLVVNPSDIVSFGNNVQSFNSNLSFPVGLWAGCIAYADVPAFSAIYAPINNATINAESQVVVVQTLQLPVLGAVGELVSRESFAPS